MDSNHAGCADCRLLRNRWWLPDRTALTSARGCVADVCRAGSCATIISQSSFWRGSIRMALRLFDGLNSTYLDRGAQFAILVVEVSPAPTSACVCVCVRACVCVCMCVSVCVRARARVCVCRPPSAHSRFMHHRDVACDAQPTSPRRGGLFPTAAARRAAPGAQAQRCGLPHRTRAAGTTGWMGLDRIGMRLLHLRGSCDGRGCTVG
jgi:hypothetical protein